MSKIIVGSFIKPDCSPAAGCTLTLQLSQDASAAGVGQVVHAPIVVTLDANGNIPSSAASPGPELDTRIWANDEVQPNGTFYIVSVTDSDLGEIFHEHLVIAGLSPINLDNIAPALR